METTLKLLAREVLFSAIHIPVKQKNKNKDRADGKDTDGKT